MDNQTSGCNDPPATTVVVVAQQGSYCRAWLETKVAAKQTKVAAKQTKVAAKQKLQSQKYPPVCMAATYGGAYRALDIDPPSVYLTACKILADAFIEAPPYSRPATKPTGHAGDNAFRGTFVREEDGVKRGRMVREHEDKEKHMREAANARPPSRVERAGYACRPDTVAAILQCAKLGSKMAGWREQQTRTLNRARSMLEPLNEMLRKAKPSPPNVRAVAGDVNLALLCALVDALDWPAAVHVVHEDP